MHVHTEEHLLYLSHIFHSVCIVWPSCVGRYIRTYVRMYNSVSASCGTYVCYCHCSVSSSCQDLCPCLLRLCGMSWMVMMTSAWWQQQLVPWIQLTGWHTRYVCTYTSLFSNVCSPVTSNNHLTSCHITSPSPHLIFPHVHPHLTSCSPSPSPHLMFTLTLTSCSPSFSPHVHPHLISCSPPPRLMFTPTSPHVHPHFHLTSCLPPPHLMFTPTSSHFHPHLHLTSCLPSPHLIFPHAHPHLTSPHLCLPSPHFTSHSHRPHLHFMLTLPHLTSPHAHRHLTFTSCPPSPSPHPYSHPHFTYSLSLPFLGPCQLTQRPLSFPCGVRGPQLCTSA